jgi:ketopantoate reductase
MSNNIKIPKMLVYGAGVIGSIFAGKMMKAGLEVEREEVLTVGFHRLTVCRSL